MKQLRSSHKFLRRALCGVLCLAVLCGANAGGALHAGAESLKVGTEIRVMALGGFYFTGQTEDFTLPEGGEQELRANPSQAAESWLWEVSTDGGKTWQTVGTGESYTITHARRNQDASGQDVPYQYRVTATNKLGETASTVIKVLVSNEYAYRTITKREKEVSTTAYMHNRTRLLVTELSWEQSSAAQVLEAQLAEGCLPYRLCDVSLVNDNDEVVSYFGSIQLEFEVGAQYNGLTLRVFHYYNGAVETYSAPVQDGKLSIVVNSLSPFLIEVPDANAHTLLVTAGQHGSVLPGGWVQVADGDDRTFFFRPDAGYEVDEVLLDGQPIPPEERVGDVYTLTNIREGHSLEVTFKEVEQTDDLHVLMILCGRHGRTLPGTVEVPHGEEVTITFLPDKGYVLDTVRVDGVEISAYPFLLEDDTYTIPAMTADCTVEVSFRKASRQPTPYEAALDCHCLVARLTGRCPFCQWLGKCLGWA